MLIWLYNRRIRTNLIKSSIRARKSWLLKLTSRKTSHASNLTSFVCYESNITNVNHNTWWINSDSTIRVANTLQGLENLRKPMRNELSILSGNKMRSHVEAIGTWKLVFSSDFILELEKTFYVPNFSRNLISVSRLVLLGYFFNFSNLSLSLFFINLI